MDIECNGDIQQTSDEAVTGIKLVVRLGRKMCF